VGDDERAGVLVHELGDERQELIGGLPPGRMHAEGVADGGVVRDPADQGPEPAARDPGGPDGGGEVEAVEAVEVGLEALEVLEDEDPEACYSPGVSP
jgi:hypothetical protein